MDMLTVSHVSKRFGSREIIKDLSLCVKQNSIYGFIGQNGAGKTTTMKMILGLCKAEGGEIYVNGELVAYGQTKTNAYIGYLPDVPEFYGYMTPKEYLDLCGSLTGLSKEKRTKKVPELLNLVGLEQADKRIHGFSRGMKQRLGIAQALINEPKLLICDEPTSALDPVGRKEILSILERVKDHTTVIFSTHILSDVERICDTIGLLHKGSLVFESSMDEIRHGGIHNTHNDGFVFEFFDAPSAMKFMGTLQKAGRAVRMDGQTRVICEDKEEKVYWQAMKMMEEQKILPMKAECMEPTLESLFMEVVGE